MNRLKTNILIGLLILVLTSCKTTQTSMLIADNYDIKTNQTTLTLLPYGTIVIPEKWTNTSYNQKSKQHFFQNIDSTTIAVSKNPKEKYPFFTTKQTDKEFVSEFVKWDAEYWKNQGLVVKTINDKSENGFIVWQASDSAKAEINTLFLFGSKNGFAYNFSGSSKTWSEEKTEEFLIKLFNNN